jgi:DNA-binding transcriptional ArsR family regulator
MEGKIYLNTEHQLKIAYDPYRMRIMEAYFKKREPQTAKQIADIINEPPGKVYYHIKKLREIDILQLEKTEFINGIQAKYYGLKYEHVLVDPELRNGRYFREIRGMARAMNFRINVEYFSKDIAKAHELTFAGETYDPGYVLSDHNKLYMTKANRSEFIRELQDLIDRYSTPDESLEVYSTLIGVARIE